jgi:hypothetical protein
MAMTPATSSSPAMGGGGIEYVDYALLLRPFELDWDTGKLY